MTGYHYWVSQMLCEICFEGSCAENTIRKIWWKASGGRTLVNYQLQKNASSLVGLLFTCLCCFHKLHWLMGFSGIKLGLKSIFSSLASESVPDRKIYLRDDKSRNLRRMSDISIWPSYILFVNVSTREMEYWGRNKYGIKLLTGWFTHGSECDCEFCSWEHFSLCETVLLS